MVLPPSGFLSSLLVLSDKLRVVRIPHMMPKILSLTRGGLRKIMRTCLTLSDFGETNLGVSKDTFSVRASMNVSSLRGSRSSVSGRSCMKSLPITLILLGIQKVAVTSNIASQKIQADCDMKATNIILQGLPADIYSLVNHHRVAKDLWERVQLLMQVNTKFLNSLPPEWSKFVTDVKLVKDLHTTNFDQLHAYLEQHELHANEVRLLRFAVPVFSLGDDPIAYLNKAMAFYRSLLKCNKFKGDKVKVILVLVIRVLYLVLGKNASRQAGLLTATTIKGEGHMTEDLDTYDSDCDDISNAKAVLMANISNYGSDFISEVPHSETYLNDMENQSVHAMQDFEQSPVVDFTDNEIHNDSNIIPYSQYLQETQLTTVQDTTLQAQQDSIIVSMIEQMSKQMINHVNN
ncbi:hypothetical protein Tco_0896670 [Tanacetum coccineum]